MWANVKFPVPYVMFLRRGWKTFACAHCLMKGHVLLFKLVESDLLSVKVFGRSGIWDRAARRRPAVVTVTSSPELPHQSFPRRTASSSSTACFLFITVIPDVLLDPRCPNPYRPSEPQPRSSPPLCLALARPALVAAATARVRPVHARRRAPPPPPAASPSPLAPVDGLAVALAGRVERPQRLAPLLASPASPPSPLPPAAAPASLCDRCAPRPLHRPPCASAGLIWPRRVAPLQPWPAAPSHTPAPFASWPRCPVWRASARRPAPPSAR
nr:vegetative cell wall protein gp1-like [Aegilops tauschii subsp. strangulata]